MRLASGPVACDVAGLLSGRDPLTTRSVDIRERLAAMRQRGRGSSASVAALARLWTRHEPLPIAGDGVWASATLWLTSTKRDSSWRLPLPTAWPAGAVALAPISVVRPRRCTAEGRSIDGC